MRKLFLVALMVSGIVAQAQGASSAAAVQTAVAQAPASTVVVVPVVANPAPSPAPAAVAPVASAPVATIAVPAPAAPPEWATTILTSVSNLPVVGPYLSKALLYLGILAAILTSLAAAALSILSALKGAFSWAGLDSAVAAITAFQSGPIMYWLTYFSNFNAKKNQTA